MTHNDIISTIIAGIIVLLGLGLIFWGYLWLDSISENQLNQENCRIMSENNHQTKLEPFYYFGVTYYDCYIKAGDKYVPYDRYRALGAD